MPDEALGIGLDLPAEHQLFQIGLAAGSQTKRARPRCLWQPRDTPPISHVERSVEAKNLLPGDVAPNADLRGGAVSAEPRPPLQLSGALVMLIPWPYTLLVIKPVNDRLQAAEPAAGRPLMERWGRLHAGRTALGAVATARCFGAALPSAGASHSAVLLLFFSRSTVAT